MLSKCNNTQQATFTIFNNCIVWRLLAIFLYETSDAWHAFQDWERVRGQVFTPLSTHINNYRDNKQDSLFWKKMKKYVFFNCFLIWFAWIFQSHVYIHHVQPPPLLRVHWSAPGVAPDIRSFSFFLATLCGLQDFSSSNRAWTWATTVKSEMLTTRPPGTSLEIFSSVLSFSRLSHSHPHMRIWHFSL